jgi:hypothetical protein
MKKLWKEWGEDVEGSAKLWYKKRMPSRSTP